MPRYDMHCDACEHEFEAEAPIAQGPPRKCPACKKLKLRQFFAKPPAYHNHMSPMHPRVNRGRGH